MPDPFHGDCLMAVKSKTFDCVEMKNRIQAELLKETTGLNNAEKAHRRDEWLRTSTDPLAVWWRTMNASHACDQEP